MRALRMVFHKTLGRCRKFLQHFRTANGAAQKLTTAIWTDILKDLLCAIFAKSALK
jgi:hypothetical protein